MRDLKSQSFISGIVMNWAVATIINHEEEAFDIKPPHDLKILFGQVLIDHKGRFDTGSWIHSSLIRRIDLSEGLVVTRNSIYCLQGEGHELTVEPEFFHLFKDGPFTPLMICDRFPQLVHTKKTANSGTFLKSNAH